jgi:hypothetical protein
MQDQRQQHRHRPAQQAEDAPRRRGLGRGALLALVVAIGAGSVVVDQLIGPSGGAASPEILTAADQEDRREAYQEAIPVDPRAVKTKRLETIDTISPETAKKLRQRTKNSDAYLAQISVRDFAKVDSDIVEITSAGIKQTVRLQSKPTTTVIAVAPPQPIAVTGAHSGIRDVTVTAVIGRRTVPIPVLSVGRTVRVPVR